MKTGNMEVCFNCGKERWVARQITGCLCGDCSRRSLEKRKKTSDTLKGYRAFRFNKGKKRGTRLGYQCSPEHIEKVRQAVLAQWRDPVKRERLVKSLLEIRSPNRVELKVLKMLNEQFPNEWKFVGDGSVIINGLSPDFINVNHKKLIVEFFGAFFHKPQEEGYKKKMYAKVGYSTFVIWSKDIQNERNRIELIKRLHSWVKAP